MTGTQFSCPYHGPYTPSGASSVASCPTCDETSRKLFGVTQPARIHDGLGRGDSLELIQECQRLREEVARLSAPPDPDAHWVQDKEDLRVIRTKTGSMIGKMDLATCAYIAVRAVTEAWAQGRSLLEATPAPAPTMGREGRERLVDAFEAAMLRYGFAQFTTGITQENLNAAHAEKESAKAALLTTHARIHDGLDLDEAERILDGHQSGTPLGVIGVAYEMLAEIRRLRATPAPAPSLTWTREKPTDEGDFWRWAPGWREPMYEQVIGEPRLKYGLYIHGEERDEYIADINDGSYWMPVQIPIPPPQPGDTKA